MARLILPFILIALLFNVCSRREAGKEKADGNSNEPARPASANAPPRDNVQEGTEVTFYPTYGYMKGSEWAIPLRGWVHEHRRLPGKVIGEIAKRIAHCEEAEIENFRSRAEDFLEDDESRQEIIIEFDADPEKQQYKFPKKSDPNGLIETELTLSGEKAQGLLEKQNSANGWLTYRAVSGGHRGTGRIHLVQPQGLSVVTDIDDTIKVTEVPAEKEIVVRNTFCRDFVSAKGMADRYKALGDGVSFHYVSGGPWQLYGPLYDFLMSGQEGFPEGTFHFSYFPKNVLSRETRTILKDLIAGALDKTYNHKVAQITTLMERFPGRKFILVGDSGELDPEVYHFIREKFPQQVQEIWIRDVVGDEAVNRERLASMNIVAKAEPTVCAAPKHFEKLSLMIKRLRNLSYNKNRNPPCG
jgi:hypothetical protein